MANEIVKKILHPDNNDNIDIYPKTSYDQVEGAPDLTQYQKKSELESDIEALGFNKVVGNPSEIGSTDLTKLKVGNTIYNIPSGGGGGLKLYRHIFTLSIPNKNYQVNLISTRGDTYNTNSDFTNDLQKMCLNIFLINQSDATSYSVLIANSIVMNIINIPTGAITSISFIGSFSVSNDTVTEI